MEWLNNLTNGENGSTISLLLITLVILLLVIIVTWIFRKITGSAARRAVRSRVPRLSITDSTMVHEKRYLVMIRRDNVEHLLLIGGANDLVVESNIIRTQTQQKSPVAQATMPVANSKAQAAPDKETMVEDNAPSITAPIAIGAAGLTAASTMTSDVASSISELATDASQSAAKQTGDITEAISNTASSMTLDVTEQSSEAVDTIVEAVSLNVETDVEVEAPNDIAIETNEVLEMDLESTISAQLDNALSEDALAIDAIGEPQVASEAMPSNEPASNTDSTDNEMQRLLDELSDEAKEPAQ